VPANPSAWRCVLTLDERRAIVAGHPAELRRAIAAGADLRIYSEFRHNEHIDTASPDDDLVRESMDMRCTYLVDGRWAAGALTLRQPVALPDGFGPRPSLSLFMYNEDGRQAIARPFLDGPPAPDRPGPSAPADHIGMSRYHETDAWDAATNAPSSNFIYDFDVLRYFVREDWSRVLHHAADGTVLSGSLDDLTEAFAAGAEIKIGLRGLSADLAGDSPDLDDSGAGGPLPHETFIQCGSCYCYTRRRLFIAATHPVVRVRPAVPMAYRTGGWDYGWLLARTDGHVARLLYDPYTLTPRRSALRCELSWFAR
jgi:hypothetical protein